MASLMSTGQAWLKMILMRFDTLTLVVDPNKPVVVAEESDTGLNTLFIDLVKGDVMDKDLFVSKIKTGNYPGYQVVNKGSMEYPMSKHDETTSNNLG
jgi:hypothetical protein